MALRFLVQVEFELFLDLARNFVSTPETADQCQPSRQHGVPPGTEGDCYSARRTRFIESANCSQLAVSDSSRVRPAAVSV